MIKKFILIITVLLLPLGSLVLPESNLFAQDAQNTAVIENQRRINTLRFGTETEIATLIQTLRSENDASMDDALLELVETSRNRNILNGILSFFGEREKKGLEDRAIRIIEERDFEADDTVLSAIDYLGRVNASTAAKVLEELIDAGENRFLNNAIRAFGRAGKENEESDNIAQFLLDYYFDGNPNNENQREIIIALGETGSALGLSFLSDIVNDPDERTVLKMAALEALSKIGNPRGLDAVIAAVSDSDPNVRSSAIAALGPFSNEEADRAILEGFRDSFFRSRLGAAQAAGRRKLEAAVPFLQFRAENDEVPAVRDEAIRALGAIWNTEAAVILEDLFFQRSNSDRVRILAGEMLILNASEQFTSRIISELDESRARSQTALYNGILGTLGPAKSPDLEDLARRFFNSGTVIEKTLALDITGNNNFLSLEEEIRSLLNESNPTLVRRAQSTLLRMGLD